MDKKTFLENFGVIADAPNGVQQLRKSVLRLAVSGLLVPQDSSDESVDFLLTSIAAEQKRSLRDVNNSDSVLPKGWKSLFLSDFVYLEMGQSPDSNSYNDRGEGLPFYQGKSGFGSFTPTPSTWCTDPNKLAQPGDVLLSVRAPVGPTNYATQLSCIGRGISALRPLCGVETRFILWWMRAFEDQIAGLATGTTFVAVSKKILENFVLPVPPLAEQKRIVAKVDELMSLCDELEVEKAKQEMLRSAARDSAIDAISNATTADELSIAWSRISNNWEVVSNSSNAFRGLQKLIYQLAFKGHFGSNCNSGDSATEGWLNTTVGEILSLEYGKPLDKTLRKEFGRVPVFGANGIKCFTDLPYVDGPGIVVGRKGSAGEVNLTSHAYWPLDVTYYVVHDPDETNLMYLYHLLKHLDLTSLAHGIKPGINRNEVYRLPVLVPPISEQKSIVTKIEELMSLCQKLEVNLSVRTDIEAAFCSASSQLLSV